MPRKILKFQAPASSLPNIQSAMVTANGRSMPTFSQTATTSTSGGLQWGSYTPPSASAQSGNLGGTSGKKGGANWNAIAGAASTASNMFSAAMADKSQYKDDPNAQTQNSVRNSIADAAISTGNPIAMAIGAASKVIDSTMDATGARASNIDKDMQEKAGLTGAQRFLNNSMNFLPGNPLAMGGKKLDNAELSLETQQIRGAYTGAVDDIESAQSMGGKRLNFMLGSKARNKMNDYINEQNQKNKLLTDISMTNTLRKQSDYAQELSKQNFNKYNGTNYQSMAIGKEGMKLPSFKDGGVVGVDSSVIPEGALHAHKNHLEETNSDLDHVTEKGIPVVVTDEKGEYEQVAEIEKEEIIFRLDLTKQLESLWKEGTENAMIRAGKLLVKEIMGNTDDNTEEMLNGDN